MYLKIAIIKLSALGDIVMSAFVCEKIKKKYPNSKISWFIQKGFEDINKHNPYINNINTIDIKSIKTNKLGIFSLIKNIRTYKKNNYDIIIDMQGLIKSALVAKLISSKNSKIIGFDKNSTKESMSSLFYDEGVSIGYEQNIVKRNYTLINKAIGLNITKQTIDNKNVCLFFEKSKNDNKINKFFLATDDKNIKIQNSKKSKNILLITGASLKNKMYKKENFKKVINDNKNKTHNFITIWANKNEKNIAIYLKNIAKNNNVSFIKNTLNLNELKELVSKCDLIIGGDSGPTHFGFGLNIASIALFGNTPAWRNAYTTKINKTLCTKNNKNINPLKLDKNDFCINNIKAKRITKLINIL